MADTTPFLFRHRGIAIGFTYVIAASLSFAFQPLWPRTAFDRFVAVDPGGRINALSGSIPLWQILVPPALVLVCWAWRSWGTSYLRGHIMADKEMHSDRLIVAGPFRWLRNPLYFGNLFLSAAFGLLLPPPGLLLVLLLQGILLGTLAHLEARGLRARHGAEYEAYARMVRAFLPLPPHAGVPDSPVAPDWSNGILTESWHAGFALYLIGVMTHQPTVIWGAVLLLFAVLLRNRIAHRAARKA